MTAEVDWIEHIEISGSERVFHCPFKWFSDSELLGTALFCSECGDIWARKWAMPQGVTEKPSFWVCTNRSCALHGNGSLFEHLFEFRAFVERAETAPRELLVHEFLCATARNHVRASAVQPVQESLDALLPDR